MRQPRNVRDKVVYINDPMRRKAVAMRAVGRSIEAIQLATGLTKYQIMYAINKLQKADTSLKEGETYYSKWRDGTGILAKGFDKIAITPLANQIGKKAGMVLRLPLAFRQ